MTAPESGPARNEYDHPSIAAAYDADNGWGRDDDFFLELATAAGVASRWAPAPTS